MKKESEKKIPNNIQIYKKPNYISMTRKVSKQAKKQKSVDKQYI